VGGDVGDFYTSLVKARAGWDEVLFKQVKSITYETHELLAWIMLECMTASIR
jgi:hypothetical protein